MAIKEFGGYDRSPVPLIQTDHFDSRSTHCFETTILGTHTPWFRHSENDFYAIARLLYNAGCNFDDDIFEFYDDIYEFDDDIYAFVSWKLSVICLLSTDVGKLDELTTFLRYQVLEIDAVKADQLAEFLMFEVSHSLASESNEIYKRIYIFCGLGADVRWKNKFGEQPLHRLLFRPWAKNRSSSIIDCACLLIKHGADVWACDNSGRTPSSIVLRRGQWNDWCKILERCGLDPGFVLRTEVDRQRSRKHLDDAERSGVDTEDLGLPGHEVSIRRRGAYTAEVDG